MKRLKPRLYALGLDTAPRRWVHRHTAGRSEQGNGDQSGTRTAHAGRCRSAVRASRRTRPCRPSARRSLPARPAPRPRATWPTRFTCCARFTAAIPAWSNLRLRHATPGAVRDWLTAASDAFERERLYLVRLTAAVGPLPSTPGVGRNRKRARPATPRPRNTRLVRTAWLRARRDHRAGRRLGRPARRAQPRRGAHGHRCPGLPACQASMRSAQ